MPPPPDPDSGEPSGQDQALSSIMGQETNAELIRALEERIEEGNGDAIELKRVRNSLLNISTRVPPEILGEIFSWNLVRPDPDPELEYHFYGFCKGSYNFLLVCHHWFQVASHNPKLWAYCGNTLGHWEKWFRRHPQPAPLDLALNDISSDSTQPSINHTVRDALKDYVARDAIRQVHLCSWNPYLLPSVISLLTPEGEGVQWRSIETIDLKHPWGATPFVSDFFTRLRLPKLRSLLLYGPLIPSSWNHLAQQTAVLTTLSLWVRTAPPSPVPTISQFLSILAANPGLQVLSLGTPTIQEDDDNKFMPQVSLQHLKRLYLDCKLRPVVKILECLAFPYPLNSLKITASTSAIESVSQTLGPFARLYFQSKNFPWDRCKVEARPSTQGFTVRVDNEYGGDGTVPLSANFEVRPAGHPLRDVMQNLCRDFVVFIAEERVRHLRTTIPSVKLEDLLIAMPKIETLELLDVEMSESFLRPNPDGLHSKSKLLPSLRSLHLNDAIRIDRDWGPLTAFLRHQTSVGQAISLHIKGVGSHMCPDVAKEIRDLVEEFTFDVPAVVVPGCPLGRCREGEVDGTLVVEWSSLVLHNSIA